LGIVRFLHVDKGILQQAVESGFGFTIKTAGGDSYQIPHRDFIAFTPKRTVAIVAVEADGEEKIAYIPLLTISSVEVDSPHAA